MENVANKIAMDYAFAVIESYLEQNPHYGQPRAECGCWSRTSA